MKKTTTPQPLEVAQQPGALLRIGVVSMLTGLGERTLWNYVHAGRLNSIKIGPRCTRFRSEDVQAFVRSFTEGPR